MFRARILLPALALIAATSIAHAAGVDRFIEFRATKLGGSDGQITLAGGGAVDPRDGIVEVGGTFRCDQDVHQGPLAGLRAGEMGRWEAVEELESANVECGAGAATQTAATGEDTIVFRAAFYRNGADSKPGRLVTVLVSRAKDGAPNLWVEGVGCAPVEVTLK